MTKRNTKLIRIYTDNDDQLIKLRRHLTRQIGEQATYADAVEALLDTLAHHKSYKDIKEKDLENEQL